jgi:hypothetical protein
VNDDLKVIPSFDGLIIDSEIFKLRKETIKGLKTLHIPNAY